MRARQCSQRSSGSTLPHPPQGPAGRQRTACPRAQHVAAGVDRFLPTTVTASVPVRARSSLSNRSGRRRSIAAAIASGSSGSSTLRATGASALADPRRRVSPPALLRPLLSAVVAATTGRLRSLSPGLLAWLLRALSALGCAPPAAWLVEAYGGLAAGLAALQPGQAAAAFLAVASLATGGGEEGPEKAAAPSPPAELLVGLYASLDAGCLRGLLDPGVALACLEAAAAAAADELADSAAVDHGQQASGGSSSSSGAGAGAGTWYPLLRPPMPQVTAEALLLRTVGLPSGDGAAAGASGPSAAVAAARALVAAATVVNPPGPAALAPLAELLAEQSGRAFSGAGGGSGGGAQPQSLIDGLAALCALAAPPLPASAATALVRGLEALMPSLDAVQVSYSVAAVHQLAPPAPSSVAEGDVSASAAFALGPAAAALVRLLPGLSAPALAAALSALPAPLRPLPAEIAAAAHEGLRRCLSAADSDDLAEVLQLLGDMDALPAYGWQGALAADVSRRLQEPAPTPSSTATSAPRSSLLPPPLAAPYRQEFANSLFALAALNYRPGFNWTGVAAAALAPAGLYGLSAGQLTSVLWALAKFGHRAEPGPWSNAAVQALQLQLPSLAPHQLSYGLGSLQRMGCHVSAAVLDEVLAAAADMITAGGGGGGGGPGEGRGASAPASPASPASPSPPSPSPSSSSRSYSPPDLVLLLMTVARLQHPPSYAFTEAVTERLRPHVVAAGRASMVGTSRRAAAVAGVAASPFGRRAASAVGLAASGTGAAAATSWEAAAVPLTCQELASVGYALAKLHSRPESEWMCSYMDACEVRMGGFEPDLLATLLWAVGELGQGPSPTWMSAFLAAARPRLPAFSPPDLVSLLSSLAALRCPPPAPWLGDALTALGARVGGLDGAGVAALLKALVDLDARVSNPDWYDALCDQVSGFLPLLRPGELVDLVASLGALGHNPSKEWLQRCCAAAARAQAQTAASAAAAAVAAAAASSDGGGGFLGEGGFSFSGVGGAGGGAAAAAGLSGPQLDALVCGLVKLGAEPPPHLLQAFFVASTAAMDRLPPQRITALASALAGARVPPQPAWLDALAATVRRDVMSYTLIQLDALTRALAVFCEAVPEHGATRDLLAFLREFCLYG